MKNGLQKKSKKRKRESEERDLKALNELLNDGLNVTSYKKLPKVKGKVKKSLETKDIKSCLEEKYDKSIKIIETIIEKFCK